jgi:transposase
MTCFRESSISAKEGVAAPSKAQYDVLESEIIDDLYCIIKSLIPPSGVRRGKPRVDDKSVFRAIVFVLATGCAWQRLPPALGVTPATAHRRFCEWSRAGLWQRGHDAVVERGCEPEIVVKSLLVLRSADARKRWRHHGRSKP